MGANRQYRNSARTQRSIKMAFLREYLVKDISQIRVARILESADISKGTFYSHFSDIYDVFEKIEDDCVTGFTSVWYSGSALNHYVDPFTTISDIFKVLENDIDFYRMIFTSDKTMTLLKKTQESFTEHVLRDEYLLKKHNGAETSARICAFLFTGTVDALKAWFQNPEALSLEYTADLLGRAIKNALDSISAPD